MGTVVQQILFLLLTALVCGYVGYWFALNRERRQEFNELTDVLFLKVESLINAHSLSCSSFSGLQDVKLFRRRLDWLQRRGFDKALARYDEARAEAEAEAGPSNAYGETEYRNPDNVKEALRGIAKCLKRK